MNGIRPVRTLFSYSSGFFSRNTEKLASSGQVKQGVKVMRMFFSGQVTQRFRDNSIVQDLEQMGVRIDGMPEVVASTIAHVSNADVRNGE